MNTPKKRGAPNRARAVHAAGVLNDFIGDLVGGVRVFLDYDSLYRGQRIPLETMVSVQRITLSHLVLTLAKFVEFYDRFKTIVPAQHQDACKELARSIRSRGIVEFRDKIVGHLWDEKARRPLLHSEIMERLQSMTNGPLLEFLAWITDARNQYPKTVVSVVETVRDTIAVEYSLTRKEIISGES
jgi:hypothetical protein